MAAVETTGRGARTYGNWRQPTSAGLVGLGTGGTVLLFLGLFVVLVMLMTGGLLEALVAAAVVGAVLLLLVTRDRHGRNVLARAGARAGWLVTRSRGLHLYRSGPLGRTPWGTYQLPGLLAATRLSEHSDSYGRRFALLYTPAAKTYSVVVGTEPDGVGLVDADQVDLWVADWGHWLAGLGDEPGLEAVSVTIETSPDSGARLRREVDRSVHAGAPAFAREVLGQVVASYPGASSMVKAYVSLTFTASARSGGRPRTPDEMGRELASRLPGLTAGLQVTGAGAAHPLSAQRLCEVVRVAYDPAAAALIDDVRAQGETPELLWTDVGPSAAQASWASYRHDGALSCTWAMTGAPRGHVQSGILGRLLAPHRDIARKRVTLLYKPIDSARAAALVEADLRAAEFRATSTTRPAARDTLAVRSARATAGEEASGAGLVNFGLLVTATVLDARDEADARAAVASLSGMARLRLRPVHGSQDSAFAAALPLGVIVSKHISVPTQLRDNL
ncbi:SCO6880 family protein [Aquipuribacter hungaricus]|uniref:SCO6880 family protein n=1 Tax=Aquipuribacter hungaricus TaxID=545624 RepID=A0ABV7WKP0_9MICO